jgi:hypothetical protein
MTTNLFPSLKQSCAVLLLLPLFVAPGTALAQATSTYSLQEEKIRGLEARVAQLEKALNRLLSERASTAPVDPDPKPEPAPAQPPAPPVQAKKSFEMPPELVPDIGKIGAQVGLLLGGSTSPFRLNNGSFAAGFIDLPLFDRPSWLHGKVSYEIVVGMSQSRTTFETTSNVAQPQPEWRHPKRCLRRKRHRASPLPRQNIQPDPPQTVAGSPLRIEIYEQFTRAMAPPPLWRSRIWHLCHHPPPKSRPWHTRHLRCKERC